jgi:hypothetical protein
MVMGLTAAGIALFFPPVASRSRSVPAAAFD